MAKKYHLITLSLLTHLWVSSSHAVKPGEKDDLDQGIPALAAPAPMDIDAKGQKRKAKEDLENKPQKKVGKEEVEDDQAPAGNPMIFEDFFKRYEVDVIEKNPHGNMSALPITLHDKLTSLDHKTSLSKILSRHPLEISNLFNQVMHAFHKKIPVESSFRTRIYHFLLVTPKKRNPFLEHFIYKTFAQKDIDSLTVAVEEYCKTIEKTENDIGRLDRLAHSSGTRIFGKKGIPVGKPQPAFLENSLWAQIKEEFRPQKANYIEEPLHIFQTLVTNIERRLQANPVLEDYVSYEGNEMIEQGAALVVKRLGLPPFPVFQKPMEENYNEYIEHIRLTPNPLSKIDANISKEIQKVVFEGLPPESQINLHGWGIPQQLYEKWIPPFPILQKKFELTQERKAALEAFFKINVRGIESYLQGKVIPEYLAQYSFIEKVGNLVKGEMGVGLFPAKDITHEIRKKIREVLLREVYLPPLEKEYLQNHPLPAQEEPGARAAKTAMTLASIDMHIDKCKECGEKSRRLKELTIAKLCNVYAQAYSKEEDDLAAHWARKFKEEAPHLPYIPAELFNKIELLSKLQSTRSIHPHILAPNQMPVGAYPAQFPQMAPRAGGVANPGLLPQGWPQQAAGNLVQPLRSNPQFDVSKYWKFDPAALREPTEEEQARYDEILKAIRETSGISDEEKKRASLSVQRFLKLHEQNDVVCRDIVASGLNYPTTVYVEQIGDILLHPDELDASLEQRAYIFYNILEAAWVAVKDRPTAKRRFIKEAFMDRGPCLEAHSKKIDKWLTDNQHLLESDDPEIIKEKMIKNRTKAENIEELGNTLYQKAREESASGKKYNIAAKDKDKILADQEAATTDEKKEECERMIGYINISLRELENRLETWMKDSGKYKELRGAVYNELLGKTSSDGDITKEDIDQITELHLSWPAAEEKDKPKV